MEITLYRGETEGQNDNGGVWFSTDPEHCRAFGDVSEYAISVNDDRVLKCHADDIIDHYHDEMGGLGQMHMNEELDVIDDFREMHEYNDGDYSPIDIVIIDEWEGGGKCVVDVGYGIK